MRTGANRCEAIGRELFCMGCGDNTTGRNCQKCNPGYYPNPKKFRTDPEYCRPCLCDSNGAAENRCDETTGQCVCNEGYTGRRYGKHAGNIPYI